MKLPIVAVIWCSAVLGQTPNLLRDARIALRLGTDQILIVGGEIRNPVYDRSMDLLPKAPGHSPFQPIEDILRVQPGYLTRFRIEPQTNWHVGDHWKVYTGAGSPLNVVIDSLSFGYYCGGIGGYATALAKIEDPRAVEVVAGLRSGEYLAAPAPGLAGISETPLVPVDVLYENTALDEIEKALSERGRKIMHDDSWHVERLEDVRRMNQVFLSGNGLRYENHSMRWRVPGWKPVLFAEAIWNNAAGKPVFGGDAVIEEGKPPAILDFSPKEGELMRVPETIGVGGWTRPEQGVFLNAWAVGQRRFVVIYTQGYEGFSVELMEIVPGKGLVKTGISFGAGC